MRSPSILIVEDDRDACEILCYAVRRRFADAVTSCADNGKSALELFREHCHDIVVTDINMPEMDGIEMAGIMRSLKPDARFIVVTAFNNRNYRERFGEIGFSDYLLKPLDFKKLFAAIENCLTELGD